MDLSWPLLEERVSAIADDWRSQRPERQTRRNLDPADFARLADAGILRAAVPESMGGLWEDSTRSTRPICGLLRTLAAVDPSVALVSAMHPAVLGYWLAPDDPTSTAWETQRRAVFESVAAGRQWGTITSEPGSGGDIFKTKTIAAPDSEASGQLSGEAFRLTGDKHFGSGSGVMSFMLTTALPVDATEPAFFVIETGGRPWDGSAGMTLTAEWDGMGMAATQSHAMRLDSCPAIRMAWDRPIGIVAAAVAPFIPNVFTAVVVGVLDEAFRTAKEQLAPKRDTMRAYERVEWTRAETEYWLATQALEGALRATESGDPKAGAYAAFRAKESVAELAEASLGRLSKVIGGGTFARRSPFAVWTQDVRALGFLRPPWGLAYDNLFATSFG